MNAYRVLRHVWILLMVAPIPAWAGMARVYVTNGAGDSIHVIDPATNKVVQQIKGIEGAHGIAFSPDGSRVYVSDEVDSTLDVFDRKSGKLLKKVALSAHPNNIAVAKDGRIVVGIARDPGALDIIDPATLTRTKSMPVHGRLHNVYVTPDSKYVVTGSIRTGIVTVIDLATEQLAWEVKLDKGIRPMAIEAGPDGSTKRIFVQLSDFNGFAVVDFAARKEVARVQLPAAKTEFETDGDRATAPSHGIGVAPDGKTLWVTSIPNNAVYVYSLADLALDRRSRASVPQAAGPWIDFGGCKLGHLHARQQDGLHFQRGSALGLGDRYHIDEADRCGSGRRGAQAHQHAEHPGPSRSAAISSEKRASLH